MEFDLIVIGAGPGGYVAAEYAAELGLKTAVIEKEHLGGTCLNRGCMPTKALIHATGLLEEMRDAAELGLTAENIGYDFAALQGRKNAVIEQLRAGIAQTFKARKVTHITGTAKILSATEVRVGEETHTAKNILVATGSVPARPPIPGLDLPGVVTSDELLSPEGRAYQSLVIIGGGVIGVEFATVYHALGCQVTIVEAADRILPTMDKEISQSLAMLLKKRGVAVNASSKVDRVEQTDDGLTVVYTNKKGEECRASAEGVLVSIGRRAFIGDLFAEGLEPKIERGALVCNEKFETSIPGIYAVGDVVYGNIQLAHVASAQGINVVHALAGKPSPVDLRYVPSCIYTNPEIAAVGMTEEQAKAAGIAVKVGKTLTSANGKSLIERMDRGFIKLVFRAEDDVIIGAQLMCARATDMISALATAIVNGLNREQLLKVMMPHPTFCESITHAVEAAKAK